MQDTGCTMQDRASGKAESKPASHIYISNLSNSALLRFEMWELGTGTRYRVPAIWHLGPGTRHRSRIDAEGRIPRTEPNAHTGYASCILPAYHA